ncbi:hypothetical protein CPLU01_14253 [Colletotrichum plurivorum]|uniref:Uncharacterized protein n=1 Tax=Colletotrichum plurivorum TaxID=2175906 RepID=A0A8H6JLX8_9PEZI|nr:hypothetical protein CPLU01_14253 [Colletotrichum plurivorum]
MLPVTIWLFRETGSPSSRRRESSVQPTQILYCYQAGTGWMGEGIQANADNVAPKYNGQPPRYCFRRKVNIGSIGERQDSTLAHMLLPWPIGGYQGQENDLVTVICTGTAVPGPGRGLLDSGLVAHHVERAGIHYLRQALVRDGSLTQAVAGFYRKQVDWDKLWIGACLEPISLGDIRAVARSYWAE